MSHSRETFDLVERLFKDLDDPVACLYWELQALAGSKSVTTAYEGTGSSDQRYGPAIFRVHYPGQTYSPHINHVRMVIDDEVMVWS